MPPSRHSLQPTGWIRASDSPAPSTSATSLTDRRSPVKPIRPAPRLSLSSALRTADTPLHSPARRLALQQRPDNHYPAPVTSAKRSRPSHSDSGSHQKKPKPASAPEKPTMQTTLNRFLDKQPRPGSRTPLSDITNSVAPDDSLHSKSPTPARNTTPRAHRSALSDHANQDDDHVFQRAQRMLKSGRFGSVPRPANASPSADPPTRQNASSSDASPSSPSHRRLSPMRRTPLAKADIARASPLQQRHESRLRRSHPLPSRSPAPTTAPRAHTTEPFPAQPMDTNETPFMHETLSNFQPFPWQEKSKHVMAQLKRRAGVRETQVRQGEQSLLAERLAEAHRRMEADSLKCDHAAAPVADEADDLDKEAEDIDETQPLGAQGGEYDDAEADQDTRRLAESSRRSTQIVTLPKAADGARKHALATQAYGASCVILCSDDGEDEVAARAPVGDRISELKPLSQRRRLLDGPQVVTRSPRTNRRVYAMETQLKDDLGGTLFRPLGDLCGTSEATAAAAATPGLAPGTAAASVSNGLRQSQSGSEPASSQKRNKGSSQPHRPLKPQSDLLAAFGGSSPLTSLSFSEELPRSSEERNTVESSATRSHQDLTAESGRDGGISESALASSSSSETPDPRRDSMDETYREVDEVALRQHLVRTPLRRLPPRKAALSTGKSAARRSFKAVAGRASPHHDTQATQPLAWDAGEKDQGLEAPPTSPPPLEGTNLEETQPLAWDSDSDGDGNASERADLEAARALNGHAVRIRASQVRSALDGESQGVTLSRPNEAVDANSGATSEDDEERRRRHTCALSSVRSFQRRLVDAAGHADGSLPVMALHQQSPPRPLARREQQTEGPHLAAFPGPQPQRTPLRPADVSPVTFNSSSPGGTDRFNAILAALHQAEREEAAEALAQQQREQAASLSGDDAKKTRGGQSDLAKFGFSLPRARSKEQQGKVPSASAAAPLPLGAASKAPLRSDLSDELSDDDDEYAQDGADDVEMPAAEHRAAQPNQGADVTLQPGHDTVARRQQPGPVTANDDDDDDATQSLPCPSDDEDLDDDDDERPKPSQATNWSETLLEVWPDVDGNQRAHTAADEHDAADTTVTAPKSDRRGLERTFSSRSSLTGLSSLPSSSQDSKDWVPTASMNGASEAARRFVHGR